MNKKLKDSIESSALSKATRKVDNIRYLESENRSGDKLKYSTTDGGAALPNYHKQ